MKLLLAGLLAVGLTACQGRTRYRGATPPPPPSTVTSETPQPAATRPDPAAPAPVAPATATAPATAPAPAAQEDPKAKRIKWAQDEAARLIRETVPLTKEVAEAVEKPLPGDRHELENLHTKAKTAHENLNAARELYLRIEIDADNQIQLQDRIKKLNDLIAVMKGALKRIEGAL